MKQSVLVSVDTEGPAGDNPIDTLIYGKTSAKKEYGIQFLMRLFERYSIRGLFFVDIAEAWDYGKNEIIKVLKTIDENGHDVGVHLHPDHMADKYRRYLWQYNYREQYEMISACTDFYEKALHCHPISFRAGRYSANNDTIDILSKLDYKFEMSSFYGNRYCRIDPPLSYNKMVRINDTKLIEVPVTSFKSFSSPFYSRFDKIDCSMDIHEFDRVMKRICLSDQVDVVSLFVHSFSVLNWRRDPNNPKLDKRLEQRLIDQIEWISNSQNMEFITESELNNILLTDIGKDNILDVSDGLLPYWFFVKRALSVIKARIIRNV